MKQIIIWPFISRSSVALSHLPFPVIGSCRLVSFGDTKPYASASATSFSEVQLDGNTAHCIRYADTQHTTALRTLLWLHKHRLFDVGRNLLRSPTPTPLLKHDQPQQVAQDSVQMAFECVHSSLTLISLPAELFSYAQMEFQVFQFLLIVSWPVTGHYCEESGSLSFIPPHIQIFRYMDETPPRPEPSLL